MRIVHERVCYRKSMSFAYFKDRIDLVLKNVENYSKESCIKDILELKNIELYIKSINSNNEFSKNDKNNYSRYISLICKSINLYFSQINGDNFESFISQITFDEVYDFWDIITSFKMIHKISQDNFESYLNNNPEHIKILVQFKEITLKYGELLYKCFCNNPHLISYIISYLFEKNNSNKTMYFSDFIQSDKYNSLFNRYINSASVNFNLLELLYDTNNNPEYGIDDVLRLAAKKRADEEKKKIFSNGISMFWQLEVGFKDNDETMEFKDENRKWSYTYDNKWISENKDFPTLLNNFIYLFEYTDLWFRSNFPKNQVHSSLFEDIFKVRGKRTYDNTSVFDMIHNLYSMQMRAYCGELEKVGIDIEDVFKWFFEVYLIEEFEADGFWFESSSKGTTYLEKFRNLCTQMDCVLKQYDFFQKYGKIDHELFEISSNNVDFSKLKSLVELKYVYAKSERIKTCITHVFNNTLLCYTETKEYLKYDNFYDVIDNETISRSEYVGHSQEHIIDYLENNNVISIKNDLIIPNKKFLFVLKQLYSKDVICYQYCGKCKEFVYSLIMGGDLCCGSTLFSKSESEYLNYALNKSEYSNGLDLRNKYIHGTNSRDVEQHKRDYYELLKIFVLIVIKINEEFCLYKHK